MRSGDDALGRSLPNHIVERIARSAFSELEGAPAHKVARRMGDVRDALDGLGVPPLSRVERQLLEAALRDLLP